MGRKAYETNLAFTTWYNQLNQLKSKIDNEIKLDIDKINEHLKRGVGMELLYSTGNTVDKIAPVVTNKLDYLYEIEIKISVRKEVLANSELKEIKLDRIKIEAIGTYAQEKINQSSKFQAEINDLHDKLANFEVTGSASYNNYVSGKPSREKFTFADNFQYVNHVQNFELTELNIATTIGFMFKQSFGNFERDFTFNNDSISLSSLTSGQKSMITDAFTKNKGLNLIINTSYNDRDAWSSIDLVTNEGSVILTFSQKGSYSAERTWSIKQSWVYAAAISVKWKHKTDLDLNGWENQIEIIKSQKTVIDNEIEYITANFNIKK